MAFMAFDRPPSQFAMTPLAEVVRNSLVKTGHGMFFSRGFGFVAGNAGFGLKLAPVQIVVEANIASVGCENKYGSIGCGVFDDSIIALCVEWRAKE